MKSGKVVGKVDEELCKKMRQIQRKYNAAKMILADVIRDRERIWRQIERELDLPENHNHDWDINTGEVKFVHKN